MRTRARVRECTGGVTTAAQPPSLTPMTLSFGENAPWFTAPSPSNPEFVFDTAAGRYVLMLFLPTDPEDRIGALRALAAHQRLLEIIRASETETTREKP